MSRTTQKKEKEKEKFTVAKPEANQQRKPTNNLHAE
jgi:hypothetical protein